MRTLYLDTTYDLVVALLDGDGRELGRDHHLGQRAASSLHVRLHTLCERLGISPADVGEVVYAAGPGFYTGMRVAFGIAETLALAGVRSVGYHAQLVPALLGERDYSWVTKAYRGEIFVHICREGRGESRLVPEVGFDPATLHGTHYVPCAAALDERLMSLLAGARHTAELAITRAAELLPLWRLLPTPPLHYFRPPEEEFRPNP